MDLTPNQIRILQLLQQRGFDTVAFPMYANHIGVRKGNSAALLAPLGSGFTIFGSPSHLIAGNLSVKIQEKGCTYFVWKRQRIEVTPQLQSELDAFSRELAGLLQSP
jgi:hypothetical protein